MGIKNALHKWVEAGLITQDQQHDILTFEKARSAGKYWRFLFGAGLLAIILGVSLIIAANWTSIPATTKLSVHILANVLMALAVWRMQPSLARDGVIALLWGATLTLMALISQTWHLSGEVEDLFRIWFIITTPMLFLFANSKGLRSLWAVMFFFWVHYEVVSYLDMHGQLSSTSQAFTTLSLIFVPSFAVISLYLFSSKVQFSADPIWHAFRVCVVIAAIGMAIISNIEFVVAKNNGFVVAPLVVWGGLLTAILLLKRHSIDFYTKIFAASFVFMAVGMLLSPVPEFISLIIFLGYVAVVGYISYTEAHLGMARFALIVFNLRLLIFFTTLYSDLLLNGFGLIAIGAFLLVSFKLGTKLDRHLTKTLMPYKPEPPHA